MAIKDDKTKKIEVIWSLETSRQFGENNNGSVYAWEERKRKAKEKMGAGCGG